jgi:enoyl-CoA hydratase/carnithine racemase
MSDSIEIEDRGTIRIVTFARPQAMNAWDRPMRCAIAEAIRAADAAAGIAGLVFTGQGERAFGAGQDLREPGPADAGEVESWVDEWEEFFSALRDCAKPTVAALNGVAAGSHFQFALLADARIGHPGIRMGQPEIKSGVASSMGPWAIHTFMGPLAAQDLALSGRLMDAEECERRGLVSRLVPVAEVLPAAAVLAEDLASRSPLAMRLTKERLRGLTETSFRAVFPLWKRYLCETLAANPR